MSARELTAEDWTAIRGAPPCSYCGKTYEAACIEAGEECTGWMTNHGPGDFRDSCCRDCRPRSHAATDRARIDYEVAQIRGDLARDSARETEQ